MACQTFAMDAIAISTHCYGLLHYLARLREDAAAEERGRAGRPRFSLALWGLGVELEGLLSVKDVLALVCAWLAIERESAHPLLSKFSH